MTGSLTDYALPRADDLPAIEFSYNVVPCRTNPLGLKGAGEAGAIGAPPALVNAIVDALAPLGIEHIDMPVTPERLWRAIRTPKGGKRHDRDSESDLLDTARQAALAAGEAIMRVYAQDFDVRQKLDKTPVTEADLAAERIIVAMLHAAFPDIPIVSEERVDAEGLPPSAPRFWVVDPLDGTREFVAKNGEFAVCIGLVEDGRPVLGVLHGPAVGLTYAAYGPGTATRQRGRRPIEPIEARIPAPEGSSSSTAARTRTAAGSPNFSQDKPVLRAQKMRQRAQIRRARGGRGRSLPALRHDDGMGHRRRPGDPRSRRRPGRNPRRRPARLRQARPQKRRLYRLGRPRTG